MGSKQHLPHATLKQSYDEDTNISLTEDVANWVHNLRKTHILTCSISIQTLFFKKDCTFQQQDATFVTRKP